MAQRIPSKKQLFNMSCEVSDNDGHIWLVTFSHYLFKREPRVMVTAKCMTKRASVLDARYNLNQILDLWPIENWPEFAKAIADESANGNDGSIHEGLF